MKKYLAWLVAVGFLPPPPKSEVGDGGGEWVGVEMEEGQREALGRVGGRGGVGG